MFPREYQLDSQRLLFYGIRIPGVENIKYPGVSLETKIIRKYYINDTKSTLGFIRRNVLSESLEVK